MPHFLKIYKSHTRLIALLIFALDSLLRISYTIDVEYDVVETDEFNNWRNNLRDLRARRKIQARIDRAFSGNFGDWKPEDGEVRAMRIDYGPGYRLY